MLYGSPSRGRCHHRTVSERFGSRPCRRPHSPEVAQATYSFCSSRASPTHSPPHAPPTQQTPTCTRRAPDSDLTGSGDCMLLKSPRPSCPYLPLPQVKSRPSRARAVQWFSPQDTCSKVSPCKDAYQATAGMRCYIAGLRSGSPRRTPRGQPCQDQASRCSYGLHAVSCSRAAHMQLTCNPGDPGGTCIFRLTYNLMVHAHTKQ